MEQAFLLSDDDCIIKPYAVMNMNSDANYISEHSTKGDFLLREFHHLDPHHLCPDASPSPYPFPPNGVPADLGSYECNPFPVIGNTQGQVMDNSQLSSTNPIGGIPEWNGIVLDYPQEDVKPLSFVMPDEASCVNNTTAPIYCNKIFTNYKGKNSTSLCGRRACKNRQKTQLVKGQWMINEDRLLIKLVGKYGLRKWSCIAQMLPGRIGKQCRERWHNHLRPDIKKATWSEEEDKILIQAHSEIGNKWAQISKQLPGRSENSIKNHWNATKRRQHTKRRSRSGGCSTASLLQQYIRSLNLNQYEQFPRKSAAEAVLRAKMAGVESTGDRLVPTHGFEEEVAEFASFGEELLFQDAGCCNIDELLEGIPCTPELATNKNIVDVTIEGFNVEMLEVGVDDGSWGEREGKEVVDLVEMISRG